MPYFTDHYSGVRYPLAAENQPGLRNAQLGALHAIGAHFTIRTDAAMVAMPTGTGKTLVLALTPFLCRARRALVVTPSRLVRNQIAKDLTSMRTARVLGAILGETPSPSTHELRSRIGSLQDWEVLRTFDVVVGTPHSISPSIADVPAPPPDLFDLVLLDEAHHTPAQTWHEVMAAFPTAKKVLFTATPFRRDRKEIKAALIYSYPIKMAYREGVFGRIRYIPVETVLGEATDVSIAKATAATFAEDRAAGLQHCVLVRTDRKKRAEALKVIYDEHTNLRLKVVHSGQTFNTVEKTLELLRSGNLDGVICVDMMSEGFDFPQLKIAAIHIPHRSLEVTLQFIGRFARTNAEHVGEAKFLAVPSEIKSETDRLYRDKAVWEELIIDLSEERLAAETTVREVLERFEQPLRAELDTDDLSLYALWPYFHVKIYETAGPIDLAQELHLPAPFTVPYQRNAPDIGATVAIANERQKPRWSDLDAFKRSEYELFIIHYDVDANLLFICASRRSDALYEAIAKHYTGGAHKILPLWKINRVLRELEHPDFFSLGMKNRLATSNTESYRTLTGPRTQKTIGKTDGRLYHRGHVFGKGTVRQESITLGYSSASKVWSNTNGQIADLIAWCRSIARNLQSDAPIPAHEGISFLSVGEQLQTFPETIIAAQWDPDVYRKLPTVHYGDENIPLTDIELALRESSPESVHLQLQLPDRTYDLTYTLNGQRYFNPIAGNDDELTVEQGRDRFGFIDYLNANPVTLYTSEFASIRGAEIFRPETFDPFDRNKLTLLNWNGVNIQREFWQDGQEHPEQSIHEHLLQYLSETTNGIIIYDHRVGEVADIITLEVTDNRPRLTFYHVKGSSAPRPGQRVQDVYEVAGQVIKSVVYINNLSSLEEKITRRLNTGSRLHRGSDQGLTAFFAQARRNGCTFAIALVQPGVSEDLSESNAHVLAAVDDYVRRAGAETVTLIATGQAGQQVQHG